MYGFDFSKTTEFLSYYALSYVENPICHPIFSRLFTNEWIEERKALLIKFIQKEFPERKLSRIEKIVKFYKAHSRVEISDLSSLENTNIKLKDNSVFDQGERSRHEHEAHLKSTEQKYDSSQNIIQPLKEISIGMIEWMRKVILNLGLDDPLQRKNVQEWAQRKINNYNEELNNLIEDHNYSRIDSNEQSKENNEENLEDWDFYEDRLSQADHQFGRMTLPSGSRKVIRVDESEHHWTTQEIDSAKLEHLNRSEVNFSKDKKNKDIENADDSDLKREFYHSHDKNMNQEENIKDEIVKEDTYEEDFEELASNEENKTQKQNEKFNLGITTQFSINNLDYSKLRNDLSDYSLLLLKNTATTEGINKNGILEKKACALLHTLKKLISDLNKFKSDPQLTRKQDWYINHPSFLKYFLYNLFLDSLTILNLQLKYTNIHTSTLK